MLLRHAATARRYCTHCYYTHDSLLLPAGTALPHGATTCCYTTLEGGAPGSGSGSGACGHVSGHGRGHVRQSASGCGCGLSPRSPAPLPSEEEEEDEEDVRFMRGRKRG
eukprot:1553982-Rhodomonas_salina.1